MSAGATARCSGVEDAGLDGVEHALNELAHLRQRWNDRLTLNNLTFAVQG
jgi:hypothetical protein